MGDEAITTDMIAAMMRHKWPNQPSYVFFQELILGTGWSNQQRADGYLLELWPSKGFEKTAFEYKVSRSDFLSEIKNPQKRQGIKNFADYFVFVTANGICKKEEIPQDCGWYEYDGSELHIRIRPPKLPSVPNPCWSFVSSLIRAAARIKEEECKISLTTKLE